MGRDYGYEIHGADSVKFDPQKFFTGLMDFFSILLPGALLTYLLMGKVGPVVLGVVTPNLPAQKPGPSSFSRAIFSAPSAFLARLLAGRVLRLGAPLRAEYTIAMLARRGRLLPSFACALLWPVFKRRAQPGRRSGDPVVKDQAACPGCVAGQERDQRASRVQALPNVDSPETRFEADCKFFRCFTVRAAGSARGAAEQPEKESV
jgi:hypothetical protein